ncbi:MAG: SPOR domain-containing protein, partial [Acidobacteria bacterium]|nr:SPOR domain-containing protein [Acidobacteriota bacterium]
MFWSLLLLLTPTLDERAATFRAWRENEHHFIRVGLQKPSRTPQFSANAPLLVLDGDRPVSIIEPKGPFWVIQENEASDRALFVQLQASRSQQYLKTTQMRLSPKVSPNMEFKIENSENSALKVLRVGPFSELEEAENFCQSAKDWGIPDAFPVIRQQKWPFAWVDQNFNKSLIEAASPAFVQLDPQQPIRLEGKGYRGILRLRDTGNGIRVINELPLEIYLLGVVPAELG